jgi:hypothetical protein
MNKAEWEARQQNIALIEQGTWTDVATFNTYKHMSATRMRSVFKVFSSMMRVKMGRNFQWIHFYERASNNTHTHSVVEFDNDEHRKNFKKHANKIWSNLLGGDANIYWDAYNDRCATYNTKQGMML